MRATGHATESQHADDQDFGKAGFPIDYVADLLSMRGAKPIVVVASPSGDDGSTATVMLARALSETGRTVVLVDMTASGAPSRLMTSEEGLSGIMDLLVGDAAFGETIHHDRLSSAHIVPQGHGAVHQTGRILDRLTMVLGALSGTYDTVLLEFGAADVAGVSRVLKYVDADVVLSVPNGDAQMLQETLNAFEEDGHTQVIPMVSASPKSDAA